MWAAETNRPCWNSARARRPAVPGAGPWPAHGAAPGPAMGRNGCPAGSRWPERHRASRWGFVPQNCAALFHSFPSGERERRKKPRCMPNACNNSQTEWPGWTAPRGRRLFELSLSRCWFIAVSYNSTRKAWRQCCAADVKLRISSLGCSHLSAPVRRLGWTQHPQPRRPGPAPSASVGAAPGPGSLPPPYQQTTRLPQPFQLVPAFWVTPCRRCPVTWVSAQPPFAAAAKQMRRSFA